MKSVDSILENLKAADFRAEQLIQFPLKKLMVAITSWPECFISWKKPSGEIPATSEEQKNWLWQKVMISKPKMISLIGPNAIEIYYRLFKANAIYPDGSYNEEAISQLTTLLHKEKKHGK